MLLPEPGSGINNSGAAGHSLAKTLPIPKVLQLSVGAAVYYSMGNSCLVGAAAHQ